MKLDFGCMRDIMLTLEKELQPNDNGVICEISPSDLCELMSDKEYSKGIIIKHLEYLCISGALIKGSQWINEDLDNIADIAYPEGYALIENLRKPDIIERLYELALIGLPEKVSDIVKALNRKESDHL